MEISEAKHALAACMQKINQFRGLFDLDCP